MPGFLGLTTTVIEHTLVPTKVITIKSRILDVAMGPNHTLCLTEDGKVITLGQNNDAHLGRGHSRTFSRSSPEAVKAMSEKEVTLIAAGSTFSVVGNYFFSYYKKYFSFRHILLFLYKNRFQ